MQRRAVLWITEAIHMSPTQGVETIAGFIPTHFHLDKIIGHHYLQAAFLPKQYMINTFIDEYHSKMALPHYIAMFYLIAKQQLKVKNLIMDGNNCLNKELSSGFCLVDTFLDYFSFVN